MAWPYIDLDTSEFVKFVVARATASKVAESKAEGEATGEARGEARGESRARVKMLSTQLQTKFGHLPAWAEQRLKTARKAQMERWAKKILTAQTLEGTIGRK